MWVDRGVELCWFETLCGMSRRKLFFEIWVVDYCGIVFLVEMCLLIGFYNL